MNRTLSIATAIMLSLQTLMAQQAPVMLDAKKVKLKEIAKLPKGIKEASGLEMTSDRLLWTHNDDRIPALYCLDTLGNLVKTVHLNHPNKGWEDLTLDRNGTMYIGAFGNNKNDRHDLKIYKLNRPDTIRSPRPQVAEATQYSYADQKFPTMPPSKNFDVDAMVSIGESLYLFTKNRSIPYTGYTKVYVIPQATGTYSVSPVDSIFLAKDNAMDNWVTSADISPDGKTLALLFHDHILFIRHFAGKKFSAGKRYQLNLNNYSHKAGLCFASNDRLYIVDELEMDILGGKLYALDLRPLMNDLK